MFIFQLSERLAYYKLTLMFFFFFPCVFVHITVNIFVISSSKIHFNWVNRAIRLIINKINQSFILWKHEEPLTLSWRRSLPYRNQSIDLLCKINRKVFLSWRTPSWKSSGSHWHELEVLLLLSIIWRYIRSRLVAPIILFDENNIPKIVFLDYCKKIHKEIEKSRLKMRG